jgi:transposase
MIVLFAITLSIARQLDKKLPRSVYSWRIKENSDELFQDLEILQLPFLKGETIRKQIDIAESWYGQWPQFVEQMEYVYERDGYTFLVISDIAAYFENLDLKVLPDILVSHLPNQIRIINFLVTMLEYWAWPAVHGAYSSRGIPQGNAVSSFLGNIYLLPLDEAFITFGKVTMLGICPSPDFTDTSLSGRMLKSEDNMNTKTRRSYTETFKEEAVRLVRESGQPVTHVARDLGIADHLLYRWRAEQQQAEERGRTRQSLQGEQAELVQLRREDAVLKQERDFLKRAAAFFAKESR